MKPKIIIVGSTGKLGSKLLKFLKKNNIKIFAATCFNNRNKLSKQKKTYEINKIFSLSEEDSRLDFIKLLKKKIHIIYFLDFGSYSLTYLNEFIKFNSNSTIAIANKEMIIAGGNILIKSIKSSNNFFIPLDSEHFSLKNNNLKNEYIDKLYITASGGPFYFSKFKNFQNVSLNQVLSHPKWKMGTNNLIDSSNFINKILEIYELSSIYNIPINKIDFIVSKSAFIHSIVKYKDGIITFNAFKNEMLLTLINPLSHFFILNHKIESEKLMMLNENLSLYYSYDKRFVFFKYYKKMKSFNHNQQINFLLLNNYAQSLYLSGKINYNDIIPFIMNSINKFPKNKKFKFLSDIVTYITNFRYT